MEKNSIGIIGYGTMGAAIAQQIKNDYSVFVFDADPAKTHDVCCATVAKNLSQLFAAAPIILIAVKPQDMLRLLKEIKSLVREKHVLMSIAAGIQTSDIEAALALPTVKVVRVMPNLLIRIGKGISCICAGKNTGETELALAEKIFSHLGKVRRLSENLMDAATALFGSAPGYESYLLEKQNINIKNNPFPDFIKNEFIPDFADIVQDKLNFNVDDARQLADLTGSATCAFIVQLGDPAILRKQVTSKGGTTEAAIEALKKGKSLKDAVEAAIRRAKKLAKLVRSAMQGE